VVVLVNPSHMLWKLSYGRVKPSSCELSWKKSAGKRPDEKRAFEQKLSSPLRFKKLHTCRDF
jgi:hypothetical protein